VSSAWRDSMADESGSAKSSRRGSLAGVTGNFLRRLSNSFKGESSHSGSLGGERRAPIFGVPLDDVLRRTPAPRIVPNIVRKCVQFIEQHGLDEEGLYRKTGDWKLIRDAKSNFDRFGDTDFEVRRRALSK
jgi:hypothetical protein